MEQFLLSLLSQYWQPAFALLLGYGLNFVFRKKIVTPEQVAPFEDYLALAIDLSVHIAERSGMPGSDKLELAKEIISQQLASAGINGDSSDVNSDRIMSDIEAAVSRYFPKQDSN